MKKEERKPRQLLSRFLDLFYPPRCCACGQIDPQPLCERCRLLLPVIRPPLCDRCGAPLSEENCTECAGKLFTFRWSRSYGTYQGGLRRAILNLKYRGWLRAVEPLGELLEHAFQATWSTPLQTAELILPVPIHRSRLLQRGFNQAELLAAELSARIGLPLQSGWLVRTLATRPQAGLSGTKRWENVQNAFRVKNPEGVRGKHILLVDDILTSGGTVHACASTLLEAGAACVSVLTVAREVGEKPP